MTVTATKLAAPVAKAFAFKGRNASLRMTALAGIASLSYAESLSRSQLVNQLRVVLGSAPKADEVKAAQLEFVVGRTAQKLQDDKPVADMIAFARQLVTAYAAPLKDGVKAKALRKGQLGRRSVVQHKAIRAAESAWSLVMAEAVPAASNAKTLAEKNKAQRAPRMSKENVAKGITHSELVKPDGPMTRDGAVDYVRTMSTTLLQFANKHAAVIPTEFGAAVKAFKAAVDKAARAAN